MAGELSARQVTKFDGKNFLSWKFQMNALFVVHGIRDIVIGERTRPSNAQSAGYAAWVKDNATAMFLISSAIEPEELEGLLTADTAKEMWDCLTSVHEQKSASNRLMLTQRFHAYRMNPSDTVVQHVAKIQVMARQLLDVGETVSDTMLTAKILGSLTSKFSQIHAAWDSVEPTRQTLTYLKERLIQEEFRLNEDTVQAEALFATSHKSKKKNNVSFQKGNKTQGKKSIKCFCCGVVGHFANKCPQKIRKQDRDSRENGGDLKDCSLVATASQRKAMLHTHAEGSESSSSQMRELLSVGMEDSWLLDSGASSHMTYRREWFADYRANRDGSTITFGDDGVCEVFGVGTVFTERCVDGKWHSLKLENVLYVPGMKKNLVSVGACTARGLSITLENNKAKILRESETIVTGVKLSNNLYKLFIRVRESNNNKSSAMVADLKTWHERLGHINLRAIKELMSKGIVSGIDVSDNKEFMCEPCQLGKAHRLPFNKNTEPRDTKPGEFLHSDVSGPMSETSLGGARYFVTFKDDASGYRFVYFMKHKAEVFEKLKVVERKITNKFGRTIKVLRSDNGLEYCNRPMKDYMESLGIEHQTTAPYTPEQNGRAERDNRTIVECARTLLEAARMPRLLWAEAVNTAVYVLNRVSTTRRAREKTPFEVWNDKKPDVGHLKIFGSPAFLHVPKQFTTKFEARSQKVFFVGYEGESTNYRVYCPEKKKVTTSRNVVFSEQKSNDCSPPGKADDDGIMLPTPVLDDCEEHRIESDVQRGERSEASTVGEAGGSKSEQESAAPVSQESHKRVLRDRSTLKQPTRYEANVAQINIPTNFLEAVNGPNSAHWKKAIDEELEAHRRNGTWSIIPRDPAVSTIASKWVFKEVRGEDGEIERFKARLCARGFQQREGVDFTETFAPVVRYDSLRVLLAYVAQEDLEMKSFDVRTAFLYGQLNEVIHMEVPEGVLAEDFKREESECLNPKNVVCVLNKSLYGLKQAPRCWNLKFKEFLSKFDFKENAGDQCIFTGNVNGFVVLLALFVDDGLIACKCLKIVNAILSELSKEFDIKISDASSFVGLQICRNRESKSVYIHQSAYVKSVLNKFGMSDCKSVSVPADPNVILQPVGSEYEGMSGVPYREAIGSLMFLSIVSRPDIAYAVNLLSRFLNRYDESHWRAVKRIFAYLSGHICLGICYRSGGSEPHLMGFSDADFASDVGTRRSTSGYMFCMANGPITWLSQRQSLVTLSTTESEYVAAAIAAKELMWLHKLVSGIGYQYESQITLFVDNQSTIRITKNPEFHKRTKHIDIRYHYLRERYEGGDLCIEYVPSELQRADILTKALPRDRFHRLCRMIGMCEC